MPIDPRRRGFIDARRDELCGVLASLRDPVLLLDRAGNLGDSLIRAGARQVVSDAIGAIEVVENQSDVRDPGDRTLVVRGSGAFDRYFHAYMPRVVLQASRRFERVLILPSTFDPRVPLVRECLSQPNVTAICREAASGYRLRHLPGSFTSVDSAVYFGDYWREPPESDHLGGGGMLLALREDAGSRLAAVGLLPAPELNDDISLTAAGPHEWLAQIRGADVVVTDRLHVAVAALLLGTELHVIETYDDKLATYFQYLLGSDARGALVWHDTGWLVREGLAVPASVP